MEKQQFNSLAQRGINYFLATYPAFRPIASEKATPKAQENAYLFILHIYQKLYDNPALLGLKDFPDDCYDDWEQQKEKPGLDGRIRKYINKTEEIIAFLFNIALNGNCEGDKILIQAISIQKSPAFIKIISNLEIKVEKTDNQYIFTLPDDTVSGLKLLSEISFNDFTNARYKNSEYLLFSRGWFDTESGFAKEIFIRNTENKAALLKLITFLEENNYIRIDNKCFSNTFSHVSLDYVKFYGDMYDKIPSAWGERTHGGIEIVYEEIRRAPFLLTLRIPFFGKLLEKADGMDEKVKNFITAVSKKCDGCGYCIQTDKTGSRPMSWVSVDEYKICPLFCGFQYKWRALDDCLVDNIIEMLDYIDESYNE